MEKRGHHRGALGRSELSCPESACRLRLRTLRTAVKSTHLLRRFRNVFLIELSAVEIECRLSVEAAMSIEMATEPRRRFVDRAEVRKRRVLFDKGKAKEPVRTSSSVFRIQFSSVQFSSVHCGHGACMVPCGRSQWLFTRRPWLSV